MRNYAGVQGMNGVILLLLLASVQLASGYILSGNLYWERTGALPHFLSQSIDPDGLNPSSCYNGPCGVNSYDYLCNSNCGDLAGGIPQTETAYPNSNILRFVVNLVLDTNLWVSGPFPFATGLEPVAGDTIDRTRWGNEAIFCRDISLSTSTPGNCIVPIFKVMSVDTTNNQAHVQWAVTANYAQLHTSIPPSATAGFNITHNFNWPRCSEDGLTGNCFCFTDECRSLTEPGVTPEEWYLKTTVKFESATTPVVQDVSPARNHHGPKIHFPAVVRVPFLEDNENATVQLVGVDEDGTTQLEWSQQGSAIAQVDSTGLLTIMPMYWRPTGNPPQFEVTRNYHFRTRVIARDTTTSSPDVDSYFQFWVLPCFRDITTAKVVKTNERGVFTYQVADAVPAVFAEVGDARCVDSMLHTVLIDGVMPFNRQACQTGNATWHQRWVTAAARHATCDVNVPCNVTMTAVAFNFTKETSCQWSDQLGSGTLCADLLDMRAGVTFDYAPVLATGEHQIGSSHENHNVARLTLAPFAGRAAYPNPYQFDIGRREIFCVTAMSNMSGPDGSRCDSLPHCLTVEVKGSVPKMLSPEATDSCPMASVPLTSTSQYLTGACPDVYLCWESETFSELAVLADDADTAETTNVQIDSASTFSEYSSELVNVSALAFLQATSSQYCRNRLQDPYATTLQGVVTSLHPASEQDCHQGVLKVSINLEYAQNGLSPLVTQNSSGGHDYALFRDDKILCFTISDNQALVWGRGVSNSFSRCHIVRLRGAPIFVQHPSLPLDTPFLTTDSRGLGSGMATLTGRLLEETTFTFRARDPNQEDPISIMFLQDPGIPNDANLGSQVCVDAGSVPNIQSDGIPKTYQMCGNTFCSTIPSPCAEAYRTFSWVPTPGSEGRNIKVCAIAKDDKNYCALSHYRRSSSCAATDFCAISATVGSSARSTTSGYYGPEHCVNIYVTPPNPSWDADTIPTEGNGTHKLAHVGCEIRWKVSATDPSNYTMRVDLADGNRLPGGAVFETISTGRTNHRDIVWTPVRGTEGSHYSVCVTAYSEITYTTELSPLPEIANPIFLNGHMSLPIRCVHISVRRCKYCANSGETLLLKMKEYSIDMNWLRLWAANGNDDGDELTNTVEDPGVLATGLLDGVQNGQLLNIGPVYRLQSGESLVAVAARFRTTVKSLLDLNPDITDVATLLPGQDLCLIPCSDS